MTTAAKEDEEVGNRSSAALESDDWSRFEIDDAASQDAQHATRMGSVRCEAKVQREKEQNSAQLHAMRLTNRNQEMRKFVSFKRAASWKLMFVIQTGQLS